MTSLQTSVRQVSPNTGYFIPVGDCRDRIYSISNGSVAVATWASGTVATLAAGGAYSTLLAPWASGTASKGPGVLRDMGKTLVSSSYTFRKVQLVTGAPSTFGVAGVAGSTAPQADWLTGYIQLGFGADSNSIVPTPVAQYGR